MSLQGGGYRPKGAAADAYNPGEPSQGHKLVRWESRFMPLKVWISQGKKLPEESIQIINQQRPQEVYNMLNTSRSSVEQLPRCMAWSPEMNQAAIAGIEQWKPFQTEGLFSFQFVDDPGEANILLFWADRLTGDESAGGISTAGNTVAVLYDANQVHNAERQFNKPVHGTPVVIEVVANPEYEKLQARVAHEFGHALGIKEHSPFNDDLMCVNGIAKVISPADAATIRWLYRQQPQFLMLPARYSSAPAVVQQAVQTQETPPENIQNDRQANRGGYQIRGAGKAADLEDDVSSLQSKNYRRPAQDGGTEVGSGAGGSVEHKYASMGNDKKKDQDEKPEKPRREKKAKKDKDEEAVDVPMPSFMRQQVEEEQRRQAQEEQERAQRQKEQKRRKQQPIQSQQEPENTAPPPKENASEGY